MTNDEAVDLIAFLLKDNTDDGKRRAKTALSAALGLIAAEGGSGWDFTKDEIDFETVDEEQRYYINQTGSLDPDLCLSPDENKHIAMIREVWYGTRKLIQRQPDDFRALYQGQTTGSSPVHWTAFGNVFKLGPTPDSEYEITVFFSKSILSIEDLPKEFQFAPIYAAKSLTQAIPGDMINLTTNADYQHLLAAMRSADGKMVWDGKSRAGSRLL